jgi:hypothetical protein
MNCANHPDIPKVAFCRTCGKALCASCTRDVKGVIYCENCLAERLGNVQAPQTVYQQVMDQGMGLKVQPLQGSGPHPAVAGILAGFFPIGVGAVYCGQYAKALAHLLIFVGLIYGANHGGNWSVLFGLGIGFYYFYQIIDAVRTAKAIQMGQPAPDPLGLGQALTGGDKVDTSKIPMAAIVLIGLGVLFLVNTSGLFDFDVDRLWPVFLILLGGWQLGRRFGLLGPAKTYDCDRCRFRGLMGPAVLITLGTLFLLDQLTNVNFDRTWPLLLVVIGVVKVLQSNASAAGHIGPLPGTVTAPPVPPPGPVSGEVQPPQSEVRHG